MRASGLAAIMAVYSFAFYMKYVLLIDGIHLFLLPFTSVQKDPTSAGALVVGGPFLWLFSFLTIGGHTVIALSSTSIVAFVVGWLFRKSRVTFESRIRWMFIFSMTIANLAVLLIGINLNSDFFYPTRVHETVSIWLLCVIVGTLSFISSYIGSMILNRLCKVI